MTDSLSREDRGPVTILRLCRGKANALDLELLEALHDALDQLEEEEHRAVVLTADGTIFSAGVDLYRVVNGGNGYLDEFLPLLGDVFVRLFWYPRPVVAAINGHAIAGGCVMACACDYRFMLDSDSATIGVPELRVQVPFPAMAIEILRFAAAQAHFQELVYLGRTYTVREAYERGLIDEIVPAGDLLERACATAERLQAIPPGGFWLTKRQLRAGARKRMDEAVATTDREVAALWRAPQTRRAIQVYLDERFGRQDDATSPRARDRSEPGQPDETR